MPAAKDMPHIRNAHELRTAAAEQRRVRVRGAVTQTGGGYSGTYRNAWLRIETAGTSVRVTASGSSALGTALVGARVDLALTLTGMVDLSEDIYHGQKAQLISMEQGAQPGG